MFPLQLKFCHSGVICPCLMAIYVYKIVESLNIFFSETIWPIFIKCHMGPSVEGLLTSWSSGSTSLNKMTTIPIYVEQDDHHSHIW